MNEVLKKALAIIEWARREGNIRPDLPELLLARTVIEQAAQIKNLETANEQLHSRLDPLIEVYSVASSIIEEARQRSTLGPAQFMPLATAVDAARKAAK